MEAKVDGTKELKVVKTSFVYRMKDAQSGVIKQIFANAAFGLLLYLVFRSLEGVLAVFLAMYLHEAAHYFVFVLNGIKAEVLILFPFGAVAAPTNQEEDKRSDLLPWWSIGWLMLAGLTLNAFLLVVGRIMIAKGVWVSMAEQIVYINSVLLILNLLPLGSLDGGHFFKAIFASLEKKYDRAVTWSVSIGATMLLGVLLVGSYFEGGLYTLLTRTFNNIALIIFLIMLPIFVGIKKKKDDDKLSKSTQAMSGRQTVVLLCFYALLCVTTFVFI